MVEQMPQETTGNAAVFRSTGTVLKPKSLNEAGSKSVPRITADIGDVDVVLGGGFMPGSVTLLAGQPGIGKSTILAQVAAKIAAHHSVLYVSGEESLEQVAARVKRLGAVHDNVHFISTNSADDVAATIRQSTYDVVVLDSIQTMALAELSAAPGSVSQITNTTNVLTMAAKQSHTTLIMIGHVTKEGSIAGPKVLEHLVDVVLSIDGDRYAGFKVLRALKNRYGSTTEAAVFEMDEKGLAPVTNPSAALLAERQSTDGSVVLATMEGNRPLLVEIQALVNTTSFGYPKRTASGFDLNRLNVLIAVIERRTNLKLSEKDVYINVVGGIKLQDPGADLAICMAIASAAAQRQLKDDAIVFGEVGLAGEVRSTPGAERRLNEAVKLGFAAAIVPPSAANGKTAGINVIAARSLRETLIAHLQ